VLADSGAVRSITSTEPSRIASVRAFSTDMMLLRATGYQMVRPYAGRAGVSCCSM
jgi:hypothetical protein